MANLREEIVDTVATTLWRLEPVINLGNGHDIEGWELLTRPHFDSHEDWLRVYALMPKVIDGMRQCHGIRQPLSINLDTRQILDSEILRQVEQFSDRDIRVEWTEYSGVDEHEKKRAGQELVRLRQIYGVEIWIDDAGNGEDAIGRMSLTQPDAIKIDGALFQSAYRGEVGESVLRALMGAAKEFGAITIIEWIETRDQLRFARKFGPALGQGFLWPGRRFALHEALGDLVQL